MITRIVACCCAALVAAIVAYAPGAEAADRDLRLVLTGIPPIIGAGSGDDLSLRMFVENAGTGDVRGLRVAVEVFSRTTTRSELHLALDEQRPQGGLISDGLAEVAAGGRVGPGAVVPVEVEIPADRLPWAGDGVHPVRVSLLHGRETVAEAITAIVHLGTAPEMPLPAMLTWPLDAAPVVDAPSRRNLAVATTRGGRLERLVRAVEHHPNALVQPLVAAHLLEDLAEEGGEEGRDLRERLREELRRRDIAPIPSAYGQPDLAGLVERGLALRAVRHVVEGQRRLEDGLGIPAAEESLWASGSVSPEIVQALLVPTRTRALLVAWDDLAPGGQMPERTPSGFARLAAGGPGLHVFVPDPWISSLLTPADASPGPAVLAQRILAETAVVHLERPFADDRLLVVAPPPGWDPPIGLADALLEAVTSAPWLALETAAETELRHGGTTVQLHPSERPGIPEAVAGELDRVRSSVAALEEALVPPASGIGDRTWSEVDRDLLRILSGAVLASGPDRALELLGAVRSSVEASLGTLTLPADAQVTLTDTDGTIPVTLRREAGPPIRVRVELHAPPRLELLDGGSRDVVLAEGERQTVSFRVRAHATGRTPVTVRVVVPAPNEPLVLARSTLVVRSTAISRTALLVLGAATGLLLALSWGRGRATHRPTLEVIRSDAA